MIGTFPISKYKMKSTFDHLSSTKTNVSFHKAIVWLRNIVLNTSHQNENIQNEIIVPFGLLSDSGLPKVIFLAASEGE